MIPETRVTPESIRGMASLPLAENDYVTPDQAGRNRDLVRNMLLVLAKVLETTTALDGLTVEI